MVSRDKVSGLYKRDSFFQRSVYVCTCMHVCGCIINDRKTNTLPDFE